MNISDIHSNLEALEAVISAYEKEKIDKYFCTGDIVGYGANSSKCLKKTRQLTDAIIVGNQDWTVVDKFPLDYFNPQALEAIIWTKDRISDSEKSFLPSLRLVYEDEDFIIVHGTLNEPHRFSYLMGISEARRSFEFLK